MRKFVRRAYYEVLKCVIVGVGGLEYPAGSLARGEICWFLDLFGSGSGLGNNRCGLGCLADGIYRGNNILIGGKNDRYLVAENSLQSRGDSR